MNRRAIAVNERLETNINGVYAIGDAIGGIMLAHVASYEGEIAVENALGASRQTDYRVVPNCIFTAPEMAGVRPKLQGPGEPFRDFVIREEADNGLPGLINLIGIESPGLTASPAIARHVAELAIRALNR